MSNEVSEAGVLACILSIALVLGGEGMTEQSNSCGPGGRDFKPSPLDQLVAGVTPVRLPEVGSEWSLEIPNTDDRTEVCEVIDETNNPA